MTNITVIILTKNEEKNIKSKYKISKANCGSYYYSRFRK